MFMIRNCVSVASSKKVIVPDTHSMHQVLQEMKHLNVSAIGGLFMSSNDHKNNHELMSIKMEKVKNWYAALSEGDKKTPETKEVLRKAIKYARPLVESGAKLFAAENTSFRNEIEADPAAKVRGKVVAKYSNRCEKNDKSQRFFATYQAALKSLYTSESMI